MTQTPYIDPGGKLLKHVDRIAAIADGQKPPPVNVEIDLTNRCNLGCQHCDFAHVHSRGPNSVHRAYDTGDVMDVGLATRILNELKDFGVRSVTWTGGGEPSTHPLFTAIIKECARIGLPQGVYTNGLWCGIYPETADVLKRCCEWVYVSLDRHTSEAYKALKQVDGFEYATNGIRSLVAAEGKATVGVGFLVGADNYPDTQYMAQFARSLGADYCQFRPAVLYDTENPGTITDDREWLTHYNCLAYYAHHKGFAIFDRARFDMYAEWQGHGYPTCRWTQLQSCITPDGRVWRCINRRGFEGDCLGNLNIERFAAIWQRSAPFAVNERCRVLCRGHLPNLTLNRILSERKGHDEFI